MPRYTLTTTRMETLYAGNHLTFNEALEHAVSCGISIIDMDLRHMDLRHITLDGGQFHNCLFDDSTLQGANLSECTFTLCDFRHSNLTDACLCYSDLIACRLDDTHIAQTDFAECFLLHCVLPVDTTPHFTTAFSMKDCIFSPTKRAHLCDHIPKNFYSPHSTCPQLRTAFSGHNPHTKELGCAD